MSTEQLTGGWRNVVANSQFLAADDFDEGAPPVRLTISGVTNEKPTNPRTRKQQERASLRFEETDKMLVLNVTKCKTIAAHCKTNKLEKWIGTKVSLQFGRVNTPNGVVNCIVLETI